MLYDAHLATAPQHIPIQHDMLPQHLVCKYELNCEYCNITLARNKAPWWWSDKIETCRSVLKCFKVLMWNYMCIRWLMNWSDSAKMHGATIRFKDLYWNIFKHVHKIRKGFVISLCLSVRPSIRLEQLDSHWTDFHEIWYFYISWV